MTTAIRVHVFLSAALIAGLAGCQTVQYTGRHQLLLVSNAKEKDLGDQAYREILSKAKLSADRDAIDLIRKVGRSLSSVADRPDFNWEFNLIEDDKQINAFCLPGGKVAFYTGILPVAQGEDGIAVVMSHEIAHAVARHGAERMSQGTLLNTGGQILGAVLGDKSAGTQQASAQVYASVATLGLLLPYSRHQESEADHIGLIFMAKAGYDPEQALLFWKRMEEATKGKHKEDPLSRFMATHPSSVKRQAQIKAWLPEMQQYRRGAGKP